jgi:hypothetical protein
MNGEAGNRRANEVYTRASHSPPTQTCFWQEYRIEHLTIAPPGRILRRYGGAGCSKTSTIKNIKRK